MIESEEGQDCLTGSLGLIAKKVKASMRSTGSRVSSW